MSNHQSTPVPPEFPRLQNSLYLSKNSHCVRDVHQNSTTVEHVKVILREREGQGIGDLKTGIGMDCSACGLYGKLELRLLQINSITFSRGDRGGQSNRN